MLETPVTFPRGGCLASHSVAGPRRCRRYQTTAARPREPHTKAPPVPPLDVEVLCVSKFGRRHVVCRIVGKEEGNNSVGNTACCTRQAVGWMRHSTPHKNKQTKQQQQQQQQQQRRRRPTTDDRRQRRWQRHATQRNTAATATSTATANATATAREAAATKKSH